jgi:hypothetical protein
VGDLVRFAKSSKLQLSHPDVGPDDVGRVIAVASDGTSLQRVDVEFPRDTVRDAEISHFDPVGSAGSGNVPPPPYSRPANGAGDAYPESDRPTTATWDRMVKEVFDRQLYENALKDEDRTANAINSRLSQQPADIRDAMRALSQEFRAQIEELNAVRPNDPARAKAYNELVALFQKMAKGLSDLADALDTAINRAVDGKPEPVFLGKAGEIARGLQRVLVKWLDESGTIIVERPLRITLFSLGVAFLHLIGADSVTAIGGLTAIVLNKGAPSSGGGRRGERGLKPRIRADG